MKSNTIIKLLILSVVLFAVGCYPPIGAKFINPFIGYGIVFITFPAWVLSMLLGIYIGVKCKTEELNSYKAAYFAWGMCLLCIAGFVVILVMPFYAS